MQNRDLSAFWRHAVIIVKEASANCSSAFNVIWSSTPPLPFARSPRAGALVIAPNKQTGVCYAGYP